MAAVIDTENLRRQAAASPLRTNEEVESTMDDFLHQLDRNVTEIRATIPHLATKAEVKDAAADLKAEISALRAEMKDGLSAANANTAALRAELKESIGVVNVAIASLRTEIRESHGDLATRIGALETRLIRWGIATLVSAIVAAAGVAKIFT